MDTSTIVEIYRAHLAEKANAINLHRDYSHQYFTLVAAILGVSAGAVYQFRAETWLVLVIGIGPVLNILLCAISIWMCNRFYRGFLEHITILAKLEALIGLTNPRQDENMGVEGIPFADDKFILPARWLESRRQPTSAEFVRTNMREGSNRLVRWTFLFLAVANTAFAIGIVVTVILRLV